MLAGTILTEASPHQGSVTTKEPTMKFTYANGSTPLVGYTIKRGIGIGGFGEVYFATTPAGKEVALKRIQRNLEVELRGVAHCLNLKHPNLLQLFDVKQDTEQESWVVMEYVSGTSLRDLLNSHPAGLDRPMVDHWFGQLAAAVSHLHANGIVHRDLKPANVFEEGGIVKLGDYGLSKFISCSQRGGHTESVGTFHYMAPEIGRGDYGKEIDIYALGIILYELLTGRVPFDGESAHEIVMKHLSDSPDLSVVPQPYREVVAVALAKDPRSRPSSVVDLLRPIGISLDAQGLARPAQFAAQPSPQRRPPVAPRSSPRVETAIGIPAEISFPETEEPLYRAVRSSAGQLRSWWQGLEQSPIARALVLFVAVAVLLLNSGWLIPVLTLMICLYVPYYILRQMVLDQSPQPGPELTQFTGHSMTLGSFPPNARIPRRLWLELARNELGSKPTLLRSSELFGSCSVATLSLAIGYGVTGMIIGRESGFAPEPLSPLFWSATVAMVGTCLILGLAKLWEPRTGTGEGLLRRLILLGTGTALGVFAFGMSNFLMLSGEFAQSSESLTRLTEWIPHSSQDAIQRPLVAAYALHFSLLLAALRWWRPADPLRRSRLTLWSVAVAVVAGWLIQQIAPVPQPWGMITAGAMSVALQISASWVTPAARVVG